jgi:hypothetical protein
LHRFEGKASFSTWLTRIAMNEALMLLRKRRGLREVPIRDSSDDEIAALGFEVPDPSLDAEVNYLKREATEILRSAIGKYPQVCGQQSNYENSVSSLAEKRLNAWVSLSPPLKRAYSKAEGSCARPCGALGSPRSAFKERPWQPNKIGLGLNTGSELRCFIRNRFGRKQKWKATHSSLNSRIASTALPHRNCSSM